MLTVGIDIGVDGGIAVARWDAAGIGGMPATMEVVAMPVIAAAGKGKRATDAAGMVAWLMPRVLPAIVDGRDGGVLVVYERVHAMPGQGTVSMFSFGRSAGIVEGVVVAMGLPVWPVEPAKWKRDLGLTRDKRLVRERAGKLLPGFAGQWPLAKHEGLAEAALLACWGHWHGVGKR